MKKRNLLITLIGWSDFVFFKDYKLPTLKEVENHIKEKGHLIDIPSAKEVEKEWNSFEVKWTLNYLQKIEELTLVYYSATKRKLRLSKRKRYKIEKQQKEIEEFKKQNSKIDKQQNEIDELKALVQKLLKDKN